MARLFSSISVETKLASSISDTANTITVNTDTGAALLGGVVVAPGDQFMVAIDPNTINEELVTITGVSGDTFNVSRGIGGTSATSHSTGAVVRHVLSGDDLTSFEDAALATAGKVDSSEYNSKGVILVGTGSGTFEPLAVGANTLVLVANNATDSGVEWANPANSLPIVIATKTGTSYTLDPSDVGKDIEMTSSAANTITIPYDGSGDFPVGSQILITQAGAGQTTISPDSGVTLQSNGNRYKLAGIYAQASLVKRSSNTWILSGNVTA